MKKVIRRSLTAAFFIVLLEIFTLFAETPSTIPDTPAGGAYSTVGDLLKFEQALKNNLLVSKETRDLLFTPKTELGARSYGYGFSVRQFEEQLKVGHTGGYTGINNHFSMYLNNGYTVIILCNIDLICGSPVSDIEFFISGLFF